MSEMDTRCRYNGPTNPRTVPGRHDGACTNEACPGCAECPSSHCRVCRNAHAAGACPECMAEVRETVREIARLCGELPEEVEHRGVEGEAMFLLGPAANPEARGHLEASVFAGRVPDDYIDAETRGWMLHPLSCFGVWEMRWRAELDHDEVEVVTMSAAVDYLDRTMSYMATWPHLSFEDFARDLRTCRTHIEAVLHDGEQVDRSRVPCLDCAALLEVRFTHQAKDDHHACTRCRRVYTAGDYAIAKAAHLASEPADRFVPISDAAQAIERSQFTIRTWINRDIVKSQRSATGRLLVWWPDVRDENRRRKSRNIARTA
jgi:hypothetical protein